PGGARGRSAGGHRAARRARRGGARPSGGAIRPHRLDRAPPAAVHGARRMTPPLVTVGVVSYNRLHYLRALIASAGECLDYPALQWVVVDGESVEAGLLAYVECLEFVDEEVIRAFI